MKFIASGTVRTALLVLLASAIGTGAMAQTLPVGFVDEAVTGGLGLPTAFTTLPDGRILVTEKDGLVRMISNGQLLPTPFIDLRASVNDYWDRGLLGIAADLNFASNGFVYLLYTYENDPNDYSGPKTGRLTRVTATGNVASPASAFTVLGTVVGRSCNDFPLGADCLPSDNPSHSIGTVKAAPDGTLFVTSGDGASFNVVDDDALRAQHLDSLAGKLLHVTTTGSGVPDNPFWNGDSSANRSKVWAYGFRNPYRLTLDPVSGVPYLGDVGWGLWEEVNTASLAAGGVNFGWPCYEGLERQAGYETKPTCQDLYGSGPNAVQSPAVSYFHSAGGSAVTAGTFYTGTSFPAQYQGVFFYADYALGFVRYFQVDDQGQKSGPLTGFGVGLNGPVYLDTDGQNLLYLSVISGELRRIRYAGANPDVSYLSDWDYAFFSSGFGPVQRDQSNGEDQSHDGRILTLAGQQYPKGIGLHAPADVRFTLGGACSLFTALVGVDDEVGSGGRVVFQVFKDGAATPAYSSGAMTGTTATRSVSVNVAGVNTLRLVVTTSSDGPADDHADWADARITCSSADTTPPTVTTVTPPSGATGVAVNTNVSAAFSESMNPATLTTTTVTLAPQGSSTPLPATVTYAAATNTVTLDPAADLTGGTTYTATIKSGGSGVKDAAGNPLAAPDMVWTFTTATGGTTVTYLSDRTWTTVANGWGPVEKDRSNGEDGAGDGLPLTLNGVTYAKGLGTHAASDIRFALGGACSLLTGQVGVDDEVGTNGSVVFQLFNGANPTALYDSGLMTGATATRAISVSVAGVNTLRLVVTPGADGDPTSDHADWADAQITCSSSGDTTPPTVTTVSPPSGATGVAVNANVMGAFSEAMTAATLTTATVTLAPQGSGTPLPATVTYTAATSTVTLDPAADLTGGTTYTATIKGGASGAKDVAANALALDRVWTFTTAAGGTTVTYLSDRTWTTVANGWGPVEKDRSNGEDGAGDGGPLTLNGVTYAKGLGVHAASEVQFALGGACSLLTAQVGVDDEVGTNGSVVFQVFGDNGATPLYDSGVMTGATATKTVSVSVAGVNTLRLVVTPGADGDPTSDHADWADAQVTCGGTANSAPTATISAVGGAGADGKFSVGDIITYSGSATDPEEGTLPGSSLSWGVVLFHCPGGNCHAHPFSNGTGTTGAFTAPDHGDDSFFEITLTATDSAGLTGTTSVTIQPQTIQLTLDTSPTGLQVVYGGIAATAPATFTTIVGGAHTIQTPSPQGTLTFANWSDGGAQQHNVVVGATNVTYVASFTDTTAPTVTMVGPAAGATGVATTTNVTGTFSTAMNAATLTTATVTLVPQGSGTPVPAAITYSAATSTVTLDPTAALAANTLYTATIKGGPSGAKDAAGRPLAADRVWTFTTAGGGTTVTYLSDRSWTTVANGWGPVEKDRSNGEDGAGDGLPLTLNGVTYAKGLGAHAGSEIRFALGGACSLLTALVGVDDEVGTNGSVVFQVFGDNGVTPLYDSGVMTGATATRNLSVSLAGVNTLRLLVTLGPDDNSYDHADWANAQITCGGSGETTVTYLSDRSWTTVANGWGPVEKDRSNGEDGAGDGGPLTLNGVTYAKGLGAHAGSDVRFALGGACSLLTALVGVDDEVGTNGSVVFQVFGDNGVTPLYDSGVMTGATATRNVSVNLTGVNTLRLLVTIGSDDNSHDHADWADAQITCSSSGGASGAEEVAGEFADAWHDLDIQPHGAGERVTTQ
ncbi:MAG: hypothetical protein GEU82_02825 [Luteitalea sp.]|nr:hypothetical protein [Luteitalea sp.]